MITERTGLPLSVGVSGASVHDSQALIPLVHRRYERNAGHFLAFTSIACTLICYRRLTK